MSSSSDSWLQDRRGCHTHRRSWSTEDHGTPHSAHSRSAVLPHAEQMTLQRWRKKWSALPRTHIIFHTQHLSHATLSHTYNYIDTYVRTYIRTYIHTYIPFYLLDLSPPPLSFLPSLSPLKPLKLIIGRSWLVGLSGPLIVFLMSLSSKNGEVSQKSFLFNLANGQIDRQTDREREREIDR